MLLREQGNIDNREHFVMFCLLRSQEKKSIEIKQGMIQHNSWPIQNNTNGQGSFMLKCE